MFGEKFRKKTDLEVELMSFNVPTSISIDNFLFAPKIFLTSIIFMTFLSYFLKISQNCLQI